MFSGDGYTYEKPLLYYATMVMLENRIDVVQIHYAYEADLLKKPLEDVTETLMADIDTVIEEVLQNGEYQDSVFLGKSLGTISIANALMKRQGFSGSKILLTPLLNIVPVFESLLKSGHAGLLVIGDQDLHFDIDKIEQLRQTRFQIEVIPNGNHSLEIGEFDTPASISAWPI
ncbi:hypothetical protein BpJC7_15270 [Weizmannia acidilactici]|uniref:Alpha/beta hydrolase n=1 Tax=Weizmannia acidilactici TaxID=2607726 RepID=A0A5J4JML2_9BACI|nr:hypothetical protein BpJC7_15270 [Weizmannia acidilactici]GER74575.1 hypothetical protein BpPP18_26420 [Weizmannia acidilactici]